VYRQIDCNFWVDNKIMKDFTPEDRLVYLYLMTNKNTTLIGCYEINTKQMAFEIGYQQDVIENILDRLEGIHKVVMLDKATDEILLLNWHKYQWSKSKKVARALQKAYPKVKSVGFQKQIGNNFYVQYGYHIDTVSIPFCTETETETETETDKSVCIKKAPHTHVEESDLVPKNCYGKYQNVFLTNEEYSDLSKELGEAMLKKCIEFLSGYVAEKNKTYNSHANTIKRWVVDAVKERETKASGKGQPSSVHIDNQRTYDYDKLLENIKAN